LLSRLGIGERIIVILIDIKEVGYNDVDWIYLAQDRVHRRAVVNTVMKLHVS
jgi:hypothetical protein